MRLIISGTIVLLLIFTTLALSKRGEILQERSGKVAKCSILGGGDKAQLAHATIKTDDGDYLIASLKKCSPNREVTIFIRRGALYFNSVYAAEPL